MMNNFNNFGFPQNKNIYTDQLNNPNGIGFGNNPYMPPTKPMEYDGFYSSQTQQQPSFWDKTKAFFSQNGGTIIKWTIGSFMTLGAIMGVNKFIKTDVPYGEGNELKEDASLMEKIKYHTCTFLNNIGILSDYKAKDENKTEDKDKAKTEDETKAEDSTSPASTTPTTSTASTSPSSPTTPTTPVSIPGIPAETEGGIGTRQKPVFDTINSDNVKIGHKINASKSNKYKNRNSIADFDGSKAIEASTIENLKKNEFQDVTQCSRQTILKYLHTKLKGCINDEKKLSNLIDSITTTTTTTKTKTSGELDDPRNDDIKTALNFLNDIINTNKNPNSSVIQELVSSLNTLSSQAGIDDDIRNKISYLMKCVILQQIETNSIINVTNSVNALLNMVYDSTGTPTLKTTESTILTNVIKDLADIGKKTENDESRKQVIENIGTIGSKSEDTSVKNAACSAIFELTKAKIKSKSDTDVTDSVNALLNMVYDSTGTPTLKTTESTILTNVIKDLADIGKETKNDKSRIQVIENIKTIIGLDINNTLKNNAINALTIDATTATAFTSDLVDKLKDVYDKTSDSTLKDSILNKLKEIAKSTDIKDDVKTQAAAAVITLEDADNINEDTINALTVSDKTADSFTPELVDKLQEVYNSAAANDLKNAIHDKLDAMQKNTNIYKDLLKSKIDTAISICNKV